MINDVIISRLNELIGEFDSPFFNYLIYSFDFSFKECEDIIENIKRDINDNEVSVNNLVSTVESYFKSKSIELEKHEKLDYLDEIIQEDSEFFEKYLKKYELKADDIHVIYIKVKNSISQNNLTSFEIKRDLEYYFSNSRKQERYIRQLNMIKGNYDTLIIKKAKKDYPILVDKDIVDVITSIQSDIISAFEFKKSIKKEFMLRCMSSAEKKKSRALNNLESLVEGNGDTFSMLVKSKNLDKSDGEKIVLEIKDDIIKGSIQPDSVDEIFLTKRFNEYNERK